MDINKKAKEYAEGKALDAITTAIEEAYASGYKDGYDAGYSAKEPIETEEEKDGVEYVDLGLPSGTLWSNGFLKKEDGGICFLTHQEASELNIPTEEQFEELHANCQYFDFADILRYLGPNGNYIEFHNVYIDKAGKREHYKNFHFWLKDNESNGLDKYCVWGDKTGGYTTSSFSGWRIPVFLVKSKD